MNVVISTSAVIMVFSLAFVAYLFESKRIKDNVDFYTINYLIGAGDIVTSVIESQSVGDEEALIRKLEHDLSKINNFGAGYVFVFSTDKKMEIHPKSHLARVDVQKANEFSSKGMLKKRNTYSTGETGNLSQAIMYVHKLSMPGNYHVAAKVYTEEAYAEIRKMLNTMFWFAPVAFLLFFVVVLAFSNSLVKPLKEGVSFASQISRGNLTATISVNRHDDVGLLSTLLNEMTTKLKEIIQFIEQGAEDVNLNSSQVNIGSQSLASGANEQASTVEELASSIEEISSNIDQVAENATNATSLTQNAASKMHEVGVSASQSNDAVRLISDKIRIITDIAFQTNILALNAAVEAARAGEHGKGFSVVASEVRKLAERSKLAADEISALSSQTVMVTSQAYTMLQKLIPEVRQTANLIEEVVAIANEQRHSMDQVNIAVQELNQVSQENAVAAEELASGTAALNEQAKGFLGMISFFKYK